MIGRIPLMLTLVLVLILLPGCPITASALLGNWTYMNDGISYGLTLLPNGQASSFPIAGFNVTLPGTLTWERNGDQFVMNQDYGSGRVIFSGLIVSNTSLDGIWMEWIGTSKGDCQNWLADKM